MQWWYAILQWGCVQTILRQNISTNIDIKIRQIGIDGSISLQWWYAILQWGGCVQTILGQNVQEYSYKNSSNRHKGSISLQWWYRYPNFREAVFKLYSKVTCHLVPYCQWFTLYKCGATVHWGPIPLNFVRKSNKSLKKKRNVHCKYRIVASTNMCCYSENEIFWILKSWIVTCRNFS